MITKPIVIRHRPGAPGRRLKWWLLAGLGLAAAALAAPSQPPLAPSGELLENAEELLATIDRAQTSIAFSPDGRTLAAAAGDAVRLWDLASGTEVRRLRVPSVSVHSLAMSPGGQTLAAGYLDHAVRLWDLAGGGVRRLEGHETVVGALAFSPDGEILASGSQGSTLRLWDVAGGTLIRQIGERSRAGYGWRDLAFSPDGQVLAVAGTNASILMYDRTGRRLPSGRIGFGITPGSGCRFSAVAFSPDGQTVAAGCDKAVRLVGFPAGYPIRFLENHEDEVLSVAFSADGKVLASGAADHTIRLWDVARGTEVRRFEGHTDRVTAVAFQPGATILASGSIDGTILWDPVSGTEVRRLGVRPSRVGALAFSADGATLAWGSHDGGISLWDLAGSIRTRRLKGDLEKISALAFSPDARTLASGAYGGTVTLWDLADGTKVRRLEGKSISVSALAFNPDASLLVSMENRGGSVLKLWNVADGTEVRHFLLERGLGRIMALSPDGRTLAVIHRDHTVRMLNLATGTEVGRVKSASDSVSSRALAFNRGGRLLAVGSSGRALGLWDLARRAELRRLEQRPMWSTAFAIRPDDNTLAVGVSRGEVLLWERRPWSEPNLFLVEGSGETWIACGGDDRCRRFDDGTLLAREHADGSLEAVPPPRDEEPSAVEVLAVPRRLETTDGDVTSFDLKLRNNGAGRAYWINVLRRPGAEEETMVFHPPPPVALVEPGQEVELTCGISAQAARLDPQGGSVPLEILVTGAHGLAVPVEAIEVHFKAPSLTWNEARWSKQEGWSSLAVTVSNTGEQDLAATEFAVDLPGLETAPDAVRESIPARSTATLEYAFAEDVEPPSAVTLKAHQLAYPMYEWTFEDQPVQLPVPLWRRHLASISLLGAVGLGLGIFGFRRQWHKRLSARAWILLAILSALVIFYFTVDVSRLPWSEEEPVGEPVDFELVHDYFTTVHSAVALEAEWITYRSLRIKQKESKTLLEALSAAAPENLWFESIRIESPLMPLGEYVAPKITLDGCAAESTAFEDFSLSHEALLRALEAVAELENVKSSARQRQRGQPCFAIDVAYRPADLPEPSFRRRLYEARWWEAQTATMKRDLPSIKTWRERILGQHRSSSHLINTESSSERAVQGVRRSVDQTAADVTRFEVSPPLETGALSTLPIAISVENATFPSLVQLFERLSRSYAVVGDVQIVVNDRLHESANASVDFAAKLPFFTAAQAAAVEARRMGPQAAEDEEPR